MGSKKRHIQFEKRQARVIVSCRVTPQALELLKKLAADNCMSLSEFVSNILEKVH